MSEVKQREFKFRAWDPVNQVMHYPDNEKFVLQFGGKIGEFNGETYDTMEWVLMQITGAKDKKGSPIWEGDVIECEYREGLPSTIGIHPLIWRGEVRWLDNNTHFSVIRKDAFSTYSVGFGGSAIKRWEVIGNIYEHKYILS